MKTYVARVPDYTTEQGDIWDIISLRCYGDEHAMHWLQDANYDFRFMDAFPANIKLIVPQTVHIEIDLSAATRIPNLKELLPWR